MDPHFPSETTVSVESTVIVENQDHLNAPPGYSAQPTVVVPNQPFQGAGMPCVGMPYVGMPGATTVVASGSVPHMGYPGQTTVIYQNPSAHYTESMEEDRDDDGYIIDDEYYYYDRRYYTDADYYDKDHYWKYFKTPNGEKFKYSRK